MQRMYHKLRVHPRNPLQHKHCACVPAQCVCSPNNVVLSDPHFKINTLASLNMANTRERERGMEGGRREGGGRERERKGGREKSYIILFS